MRFPCSPRLWIAGNNLVNNVQFLAVTVYTGGARNTERGYAELLINTLFAQNKDRERQEHTLMTLQLDTEAGKHRAYKGQETNEQTR